MSRTDDLDFEPVVGRSRSSGENGKGRSLSYRRQVMRAVARAGGNPRKIGRAVPQPKTGRFNTRGRGSKVVAGFPRDNGWRFDGDAGMRVRPRRVVVKARVVKMRGGHAQAAAAHLRYLQRDGVTRDGERGQLYSSFDDNADAARFLDRSQDDRHQFRLIVAPEDSAEFDDLHSVTRRLMERMEADLDTRLDWVAVDHFNTGHPHSHVVIRGVTDDDKILNIAGDYIAHGIRHRASEVMDHYLGPQSEWELRQSLRTEIDQDRFTRLDRTLLHDANDQRVIDLRAVQDQTFDGVNRAFLVGRLKKLERLGLAQLTEESQSWTLSPDMEKTLREMGERGDIIKTMHRALTARGIDRGGDAYLVHGDKCLDRPVVGRLVSKGLAGDELTDHLHVVVDGIDGRVHYIELTASEAGTAKSGSIIEIGLSPVEPRPADRNIAARAGLNDGIYQPSQHLANARDTMQVPGNDYQGYVTTHVRRLEALRRAGIVERLGSGPIKSLASF